MLAKEISGFFVISEFVDIFWIRGHQFSTASRASRFLMIVVYFRYIYQVFGVSIPIYQLQVPTVGEGDFAGD